MQELEEASKVVLVLGFRIIVERVSLVSLGVLPRELLATMKHFWSRRVAVSDYCRTKSIWHTAIVT